ncbi:hypothetical protein [Francisella tularensis]|uniref:hypothetical protein n=1 Tax=Francisella tularensis TaxID=263 RepID=UPI002381CF32|nr:hypothetical protein [Francisella tularensis]MDE5032003.1 hypothetical protein [Francisella tularensis subsp. holarctica]
MQIVSRVLGQLQDHMYAKHANQATKNICKITETQNKIDKQLKSLDEKQKIGVNF